MMRRCQARWLCAAMVGMAAGWPAGEAAGQCVGRWTNQGLPHPAPPVQRMAVRDPDGPGPRGPELLTAGTQSIATVDLRTGQSTSLGSLVAGYNGVTGLAEMGDGRFAVTGWLSSFTPTGGTSLAASGGLIIDGGNVQSLGMPIGANATSHAFWIAPGGLLPPGLFVYRGAGTGHFMRLDGEVWSGLPRFGAVLPAARVATALLPDGSLAVNEGSDARTPSSLTRSLVSMFDGTSWRPLGGLWPSGYAGTGPMVALDDGSIVLAVRQSGAPGGSSGWLYRYDPGAASWQLWAPSGPRLATAMVALPGGRVMVGFSTPSAGAAPDGVLLCREGACERAGEGLALSVADLVVLPDGDVLAAGTAVQIGGQTQLFRFTTRPVCAVDQNCDGVAGVGDLFVYLAGWFTGSTRFDADGDLRLDINDLFAFLSAWFAGC